MGESSQTQLFTRSGLWTGSEVTVQRGMTDEAHGDTIVHGDTMVRGDTIVHGDTMVHGDSMVT